MVESCCRSQTLVPVSGVRCCLVYSTNREDHFTVNSDASFPGMEAES